MRSLNRNFLHAAVLLWMLGGCTTFVGGAKPTDLTSIGAGSSRVQVENLLRQPILEQNSEFGSAAVYRYQSTGVSGACEDSRCAYFLFMPFLWPFQEYYAREEATEGMRFLTVVYDDNGKICQAYGGYSEPDTALDLLQDANEGDAAANTTLGVRAIVYAGEIPRQCRADLPSKPGKLQSSQSMQTFQLENELEGLLVRANCGNKAYQRLLGTSYLSDPRDPVQALKWFILAARDQGPKPTLRQQTDNLRAEMSAAMIAEAERLAAEWQPKTEGCE